MVRRPAPRSIARGSRRTRGRAAGAEGARVPPTPDGVTASDSALLPFPTRLTCRDGESPTRSYVTSPDFARRMQDRRQRTPTPGGVGAVERPFGAQPFAPRSTGGSASIPLQYWRHHDGHSQKEQCQEVDASFRREEVVGQKVERQALGRAEVVGAQVDAEVFVVEALQQQQPPPVELEAVLALIIALGRKKKPATLPAFFFWWRRRGVRPPYRA